MWRRWVLESIEYLAGGLIAALVLVYLVYALLRPERF
jgi:K+-transporting ATPase KdpF subunit